MDFTAHTMGLQALMSTPFMVAEQVALKRLSAYVAGKEKTKALEQRLRFLKN
jgi:hypothetical protein